MTTTCPFCGAALQDGCSQGDSPWYQCDTVMHGGRMHQRRGQTIRCIESEVARLTRERDEAGAEVARLKAGGCARDQRTTQFCAEAVALQERVKRLEVALLPILAMHLEYKELVEGGNSTYADAHRCFYKGKSEIWSTAVGALFNLHEQPKSKEAKP